MPNSKRYTAVKPLDLSYVIRDAFLSGRGLKDGAKLTDADQAAWMAYDPAASDSYNRIFNALYFTKAEGRSNAQ